MRRVITAADLQQEDIARAGVIYIEDGVIITPLARDTAKERGLQLVLGKPPGEDNSTQPAESQATGTSMAEFSAAAAANLDASIISVIVEAVLTRLGRNNNSFSYAADPSGLRHINGKSVVCEPFPDAGAGHKVRLKDILTVSESQHMACGFMTMEKASFELALAYDEIQFIIEGRLNLGVDGRTYEGRAGDVFFVPQGTRITFDCPDWVRLLYVTYPANWSELKNNER